MRRNFTLDEVRDFAALWGEETTTISGIDTTLIRFAGDTQLAFPAEWVYGTPPSELKEDTCAVSTGFALECFGGQDVVGLKLCENTICGVFRHKEAVVLKPAREGFTAAELFPVPKKADLYRWGLDCAARAGLPEPSEVLCGTEGAFLAQLLPWTILVWLLLRLTGRKRWLIAALLLLLLLPDWFIPTRLSDTVFRMELGDSILGRFRDGLSLSPALRDQAWKEAWLRFCAAMLCCCILSNRQTKLSVIIRIAGCKNGLPLLSEVHFMISSVPKGCRFQKTIR